MHGCDGWQAGIRASRAAAALLTLAAGLLDGLHRCTAVLDLMLDFKAAGDHEMDLCAITGVVSTDEPTQNSLELPCLLALSIARTRATCCCVWAAVVC